MEGWIGYALMTVMCWGLYGVFLAEGAASMSDPAHGRIKAFLFVGVAYFLVAILAPAATLLARGAAWTFPLSGAGMSLVAGVVGALGAFGVLLAYGAGGTPPVVMAIVFSGAPVVNALVGVTRLGLWSEIRWQFVLGLFLAAAGGGLVTVYRPAPPNPHAPPPATTAPAAR